MAKPKLTPPDRKRCQALVPNGHSFMSLGGKPGRDRCPCQPTVIVTERRKGSDGLRGSMSLCDACLAVLIRQMGATYATQKRIAHRAVRRGQP